MEELKIFLLLSATVLFIFVFYRWLLRYLQRKEITVPFCYLFPFENHTFSGREKIKLDMCNSHTVIIEIFEPDHRDEKYIAFQGRLAAGVCEVDIDLTSLRSGNYYLKIVLPDQSITRFIEISNA